MERQCKVKHEKMSKQEKAEILDSTTGLSPLAETLFLSPPNVNSENKFGFGGKLVRATSTPSYSSLLKLIEDKDPLFTADIQLDREDEHIEKRVHRRDNNIIHDSVLESCNSSCNSCDTSSVPNRGK